MPNTVNTVLLLGAGLTRAATTEKSKSKIPPLDADFFEIARAAFPSETTEVEMCLRSLVGDYSRELTNSLETATTYLYLKAMKSVRRDDYHRGFLNLLTLLNMLLAKTTNEIKVASPALIYRFILKELHKAEKPENLTIITFNYDLLLERVLEEVASANGSNVFCFPGCYRISDQKLNVRRVRGRGIFKHNSDEYKGVAVLKLHGSLNWHSVHISSDPTPTELLNTSRRLLITNSPIINPNLTTKKSNRTYYVKPIVVPPVSGKNYVTHVKINGLWEKAGEALQKATRVVIAGYSCPPLDIEARILISENLRDNNLQNIFVINPDMESVAKFSQLCSVDNAIIYNNIKSWVRSEQ